MQTSDPIPAAATVLIVEDEPKMAALLADYLRAAGYASRCVGDGNLVAGALAREPIALVLLDLMLPGKDGLAVCRELRTHSDVPIIMLTARVEEADRLLGLEIGADDYICKTPFSPREVVARVKALLRRARATAGAKPAAVRLRIDEHAWRATFDGVALDLTPVEFRLLRTLAETPGRVFSRAALLDKLHDDTRDVTDRAVDTHVKNLRRKMQQASAGEDPLRSIYGVGYRLDL